jgi:hypothetical protein
VLLLRPDVQVWFDGRFDYWGLDRILEAGRVLSSSTVDESPLSEATCVILSTKDQFSGGALATALDESGAWANVPTAGSVRAWVRSP